MQFPQQPLRSSNRGRGAGSGTKLARRGIPWSEWCAPLLVNLEGTGVGKVKETQDGRAATSDFRPRVSTSSRPTAGRWRKHTSSNAAGPNFTLQQSPDTSELQNSDTQGQSDPGSHVTTPVSLGRPSQRSGIDHTPETGPLTPTPAWESTL